MRQEIGFGGSIPLWKVSWSQVGNMLAISGGDNQVRIMSENANGEWNQIQVVNEESSQEQSSTGQAVAAAGGNTGAAAGGGAPTMVNSAAAGAMMMGQ